VVEAEVAPNAPERFGRYVLLDRIGVGGMAEVFRAVMPGAEGFARTFVVKRILGELSRSTRFVEMFIEEARICALLSHPAIVQVYDFGAVDGNYFLAMEYLRGRDLASVMRKLRRLGRACPPALAAYLGHQLAEGLGYAHELADADGAPLNIIHRDVSPANIVCLRTGGVKLLDFGIAKAIGVAAAAAGKPEGFRGKVAYASPEQVRGEPIDRRLDLFSLGIVLWETLTGRRLFKGANDNETLSNILSMPVPPPSSLRPDVPPALDAIVARALERDPARRYQSGQEMAEDLEEIERELKHQSKLLPNLLQELFGAEGTTSAHPAARLPPELLAAAMGEGTGSASAVPAAGPTGTLTLTPKPIRVLRRSIGIATAAVLTGALALKRCRSRPRRPPPPPRPWSFPPSRCAPLCRAPIPRSRPLPRPPTRTTPRRAPRSGAAFAISTTESRAGCRSIRSLKRPRVTRSDEHASDYPDPRLDGGRFARRRPPALPPNARRDATSSLARRTSRPASTRRRSPTTKRGTPFTRCRGF
jgi:serine/threonine protein kinase